MKKKVFREMYNTIEENKKVVGICMTLKQCANPQNVVKEKKKTTKKKVEK